MQCSTLLLSLTSLCELTNKTIVNYSALLLRIFRPHALFLRSQGGEFANIDIWEDFVLNNPAHARNTRKIMHNKRARELTKKGNKCDISTKCSESKLPYRDSGYPNQTRKRADMMTLQGWCDQPNHHLNFWRSTHFIIDVTMGRVYNLHHSYKPGNLRQIEGSKWQRYLENYQQQRFAFAAMVANSLAQCGPESRFSKFSLANSASCSPNSVWFYCVWGESIMKTASVYWRASLCVLLNSNQYQQWLAQTRHNWLHRALFMIYRPKHQIHV